MVECPLCDNDSHFELVLTKENEGFECRLKKCSRCQLVFMDPQPDKALQKRLVDTSTVYDAKSDEEGMQQYRAVMDYIERFAKPPGRLLEIGCARGYLLVLANKSGWQTMGVEFSRKWAEYARSRLGLNVVEEWLDGSSFDLELTGQFDVIVMWHFLEHVNNPRRFLEQLAPYLKDLGIIIMQVPDFSRLGDTVVGCHHLNYFTPDTLQRLVNCNYDIIDCSYDNVNKFVSVTASKKNYAESIPPRLRAELQKLKDELTRARQRESPRLRAELQKLKDELTRARQRESELQLRLVRSSFGYRIRRFYGSRIDRICPEGTGRGEIKKLVAVSLRIIREEGMRSYLRQALKEIRRRKFGSDSGFHTKDAQP